MRLKNLMMSLVIGVLAGMGIFSHIIFFRAPVNAPREFLKKERHPSTKTLVLCLGDSLTHATTSGDYVALLREKFAPQVYEFINAGINGDTTNHLLKRLDAVIACQPDIVTILVGTNDVNATRPGRAAVQYLLPYTPTLERYRQNYDTILTRLKTETKARIAILSIPPLAEDLDSEINQRVAQYSAAIKDIAAAHGVTYLPLHEELTALLDSRQPSSTFKGDIGLVIKASFKHHIMGKSWDEVSAANGFAVMTDAIHLNDRGAAVVAKLIANGILE
jgi:acyl-CoA thioesterase I